MTLLKGMLRGTLGEARVARYKLNAWDLRVTTVIEDRPLGTCLPWQIQTPGAGGKVYSAAWVTNCSAEPF